MQWIEQDIKIQKANQKFISEDLKIKFDTTKPDGQFRKDVSNGLMKKIMPDFKFTELYDGIKKTYEFLKEKQSW